MKCEHRALKEYMHTGSLAARMFVMKKGDDRRVNLRRWKEEVRKTWPCCMLFMRL
jgi:hypothetical protein